MQTEPQNRGDRSTRNKTTRGWETRRGWVGRVEGQGPVGHVVLYPLSPWPKGGGAHQWEGVGDPVTEKEGAQYRRLCLEGPPEQGIWMNSGVGGGGFLEEVWEVSPSPQGLHYKERIF